VRAPLTKLPPATTAPALQAQICDLLAILLRERAGHPAPPALAQQLEDLAAKLRDQDDEQVTVAQAAIIAGVSVVAMRKWVIKHNLGRFDPRSHIFWISKRRLDDLLVSRRKPNAT
jgi:hypothetical protein